MDESEQHEREAGVAARRRSRTAVTSKAIPYGSDELNTFLFEDYDTSWEINHTVTPPPL